MNQPRILIAEDEGKMRRILQIILSSQKYAIDLAQDGNEAWQKFQQSQYDLVITDLKMPGMDGMQLLERLCADKPHVPVIVITAYGSVDSAVKAMKEGAYDYIGKPFENEEIQLIVAKALNYSRLQDENRYLREAVGARYGFEHFIGESDQIR